MPARCATPLPLPCTGLPEVGIVPLDPLNVTEVRIFQGEGPVSVNAKLTNVTIVGFSGAKIDANM